MQVRAAAARIGPAGSSSNSLWCVSPSSSSSPFTRSSSSSEDELPSAGTATAPVVVSNEGGKERRASEADVGPLAGEEQQEQEEAGNAFLGGVEIQPLLRKHIDMLGPRGRRK